MAKSPASNQDKPEKKEFKFEDLTPQEQVVWLYQHRSYSIQTLARSYKMEVDEVLSLIGEGNLASVYQHGDQVGQDEIGEADFNPGKDIKVPFTTN